MQEIFLFRYFMFCIVAKKQTWNLKVAVCWDSEFTLFARTATKRNKKENGNALTIVYTVEPPLAATSPQRPFFQADNPYIDSCLNLSTTATFFCRQSVRCGEFQLYRELIKWNI